MASFGRSVGVVPSVGPFRVSQQRCHFRVRHPQALRRGFIFISLKWWGSICLTLSLLWYCAYEKALEFPLWTAPQTHRVIPGCPGLFSSSTNLSWAWPHQWSSSVSGRVGAQSTSRSLQTCTVSYTKNSGITWCISDARVGALTLYPDAHCNPTVNLLKSRSEDQELLYFDI